MSTIFMINSTETPFEQFLNQNDEEAWAAALTTLLRSVHEVDKNATQIWFSFFPLALFRAFEASADPELLAAQLLVRGVYPLKKQIDSSHKFLYGHRYWSEVKKGVETFTASFTAGDSAGLADQILKVAGDLAQTLKVDQSLTVGITAVAFMTVHQASLPAFMNAKGGMLLDRKHAKKSPEQVLRDRAVDDSQGLFGFLKTIDKKWTVTHDENDDAAKYKLNNAQDLAWGAEADRSRNWRELDPRRVEGPIPVECRSASC